MLAELGSQADLRRSGMLFEVKLDGTRALVYKIGRQVRALNRRWAWIERRYPELFPDIRKNISARSCILDGEIVVFDPATGKPDFYKLAEREHQEKALRIEILSKTMPATYVVFDILSLHGRDLTGLPLTRRKEILAQIISDSPRIKLCYYTDKGLRLWRAVKRLGIEGVMAKRADSRYLPGTRAASWLKVKTLKSLDVVIGGWTEGTGKRAGLFGALLCGIYHKGRLTYIGRVGTGWSQRQLQDYARVLRKIEIRKCPFDVFAEEPAILGKIHFAKPLLVAEVRFMNLSAGLRMRASAFRFFRVDKRPADCVLTERDISKLMIA
jgi:DNA ligase D-like protein (predicted ligase)